MKNSSNILITVVFDNYKVNSELRTSWGFGCVVEIEDQQILFDTGGNGEILLLNMNDLEIDPSKIDFVFLSHSHDDHTGGLMDFLETNSRVSVYPLKSFPESLKTQMTSTGAGLIEVDEPLEITNNVYSTGEMVERQAEHSMVIKSSKGLIIITGCAHPGIINIIKKAKELYGDEVFLVMGGFHLNGLSEAELRDIAKKFKMLGVKKVAPSHCSGDLTRKIFQEIYDKNYIESGVGAIIAIAVK
ncbi:MBL fold metallo-hydrolase [Candidatus Peregrinibacteria bacterium]|nr:MBL fold metallo-hydrolase [Candidatus Peregrinibacteria bacterium]